MPHYPVIGIAGRARSGKDSLANFILVGRGGYLYSFADPIRQMLRPLGVDMSDPYWQEHKEDVIPTIGVSPRRLMQTLGTDWGREMINDSLWLILAQQRLLRAGPGMIISDVRFENEATWIRARGGVVVHLKRTNNIDIEPHASENGIEVQSTDFQLSNNGSLADLQQTARDIFSEHQT